MCKHDQNMEILLENLIRMQGKLNVKMEQLNRRLNQVEFALAKTPPLDKPTGQQAPILCRNL